MTSDEQLQLILAFDSDAREFTRGFEAGQLWQLLDTWTLIDRLFHTSNTEMIMRMAEVKGFDFSAVDVDDTWTQVLLIRRRELNT